jgi:hypothetical protein
MVACPRCPSAEYSKYKKIGHTYHGEQNHYCKAYERHFVWCADKHLISAETCALTEYLLLGCISL